MAGFEKVPTSRTVRFPIPQLGLKDVASYFAIPKMNRIQDGLEVLHLFQEYRDSRNKERRDEIKTSLLEYNREDLEALVGVAQRISALRCSNEPIK